MAERESSPGKPDPNDKKKREQQQNRQLRYGFSYLITSLIALWLFQIFVLTPLTRRSEIPYSEFKKKLADGQIVEVMIGQQGITGQMKNPKADGNPPVVPFTSIPAPAGDPKLIEELQSANVTYRFERPPSPLGSILLGYVLPMVLLGGFIVSGRVVAKTQPHGAFCHGVNGRVAFHKDSEKFFASKPGECRWLVHRGGINVIKPNHVFIDQFLGHGLAHFGQEFNRIEIARDAHQPGPDVGVAGFGEG